ncbi:MAG: hypothetical protein IJ558_00410 [Treponema sp.]|nr:hypothetical protein [Treponema sp.]
MKTHCETVSACIKIMTFFVFLSLLYGCADKLNEEHPDACERLADEIGFVYNPGDDSSNSSSSSSSSSTAVTGTLLYSDSYIIYRFYASSRTTYNVTWTNGDGALMYVSAGTSSSNPTDEFGKATTSGKSIYLYSSSYVYIKVMPTDESHTGSFSLSVTANPYTGSYGVVLTEYTTYGGTAPTIPEPSPVTAVSVSSYFSNAFSDFTNTYVSSSDSKTYSFVVESGYVYYFVMRDSDEYIAWFSENGYTATDATYALYDSTGDVVGTVDDSDFYYLHPESYGTYTLTVSLSPSTKTAGYALFRIFRRATSSFSPSTTLLVNAADSSLASGFKKIQISALQTYDFAISLSAGKTYAFHWVDSDNPSILSSYTLADGIFVLYDSSGMWHLWSDSTENLTFTPETSGTYTLSVQTFGSSSSSGYVGIRVYAQ